MLVVLKVKSGDNRIAVYKSRFAAMGGIVYQEINRQTFVAHCKYIILQIQCILKDIIISKMLSLSRILLHHNHASVQYVGMN